MTPIEISDSAVTRLTDIRRSLHAHPQLGYEETFAGKTICDRLDAWEVPYASGLAETGVVAWLLPDDPDAAARPGIALRADMDALPIHEKTRLAYASQYDGRMHACGHDGHTTLLLGAAQALADRRAELTRPVKFIFQPAEEVGAGAKRMIEDGALSEKFGGFGVDRVIGLHNWPQLPEGAIAVPRGPAMAGTEHLAITLRGQGGHAAMPHLTADLNVAAAAMIQALQAVVSRAVCPTDAAVLSIARIAAGHAHNVLPAHVELEGTLRYFTDATHDTLHRRTQEIVRGIALAYGCDAEALITDGYPPVINDPAAADRVADTARALGIPVVEGYPPSTAAEDFSFYGEHAASAFFFLGATPDGAQPVDLHRDTYDFNDRLIPIGVRLLTALALDHAA